MTTGGVFGTPWPAGGTRTGPGPRGPLLGVLTGELWLVAGEDTGEDSLLMEDAAGERKNERKKKMRQANSLCFALLIKQQMQQQYCMILQLLHLGMKRTAVRQWQQITHAQRARWMALGPYYEVTVIRMSSPVRVTQP